MFKKYLAGMGLAVVVLLGIGVMVYFALQPRPIQKIKISVFENSRVAGNSILLRLNQELKQTQILVWGLEPTAPAEHLSVLMAFNELSPASGVGEWTFLVDADLQGKVPALASLPGERFALPQDLERVLVGLQNAINSNRKVILVLPAVYAASFLDGSPASVLREKQIPFLSLIMAPFPRLREQERDMSIPCDVADADQTGTGQLGCMIVSTARLNYRKKFQAGDWVGLMNQVSGFDYLFLYAREPK